MNRNVVLVLTIITLLLAACSAPLLAPTSADDVGIALAQESRPAVAPAPDTGVDKGTDQDEARARPEGWREETHDKSADPNYEVVFPQDEVKRIDFTITPENWEAMLEDMTTLYGEAGSGQGGPGGRMPPDGGRPWGGNRPPGEDGGRPPMPEGDVPLEGEAPVRPDMDAPGMRGNRPPMGGPGGMMMDSSVNPIYVPVTVEFEDKTWTHVGLRFKGNSSLRSTWGSGNMKLPFRLDFDEFEDDYPEVDDQRFYGFKQLAFSSNFSDASFLREKVTADIFREAGVPAAQTAFYEVYIDYGEGPIYFGLYTLTEIVDDTVIETQFEDDGGKDHPQGNVYKPEGGGATFAEGTFSEQAFEKQSNKEEADWSDIQALFDALHADLRTSDPEAWRSALETVFDVDGFLNWLAVNTVVQNWDTYGVGAHNYYLYHDPTTDKIVWIPWDNNMALSSNMGMRNVVSLSLEEVDENWPLIRYLLDDAVYHAQYVAYVDAVIHGAFEPGNMEALYRDLAALVAPYALSENAEHTLLKSEEAFYAAIEDLIKHTYARYEAAAEFIASQP